MTNNAIAVIGLSAELPGWDSIESAWAAIQDGATAFAPPAPGRWSWEPPVATAVTPDHVRSRNVAAIDRRIHLPNESQLETGILNGLDPVFPLTLSGAHQAWASAGHPDPHRAAVIFGAILLPTDSTNACFSAEHLDHLAAAAGLRPPQRSKSDQRNWNFAGLLAGLTAKSLGAHNLSGGSCTIDAACASSLYAIEMAARRLLHGQCDVALAGGCSRPDSLYTQMGFSALGALSPSGQCRPFDAAADGLLVGEGAAFVVLKRWEDAQRDGDTIHAVLHGAGLSNDLRGSLFQPAAEGQLRALDAAYRSAGWSPESVGLIECHGTGTPTGDKVELTSLADLWLSQAEKPTAGSCVLGSIKSNIGHLLTGAGAAGVLKTVLALRDGVLPPTANFSRPADGSPLADPQSPFRVLTEAEPWTAPEGKRAAVSAFGFGGINAHLLFSEGLAKKSSFIRAPQAADPSPIAVTGCAVRLGDLSDAQALSELLQPTQTASYQATEDRLPHGVFPLPPAEITSLMPQQLLLLTTARRALAQAGEIDLKQSRPRTGVFVGAEQDKAPHQFHLRWSLAAAGADAAGQASAAPALEAAGVMGHLGGITASRLARAVRAGGPSHTLAAGAASGMAALHTAIDRLQRQEIDRAIVAAVHTAGGAENQSPPAAADASPQQAATGHDAVVVLILEAADRADPERVLAICDGIDDSDATTATARLKTWHRSQAADLWCCDALAPLPTEEIEPLVPPSMRSDIPAGSFGAAAGLLRVAQACTALHREVTPAAQAAQTDMAPVSCTSAAPWLHDYAAGRRRAIASDCGPDDRWYSVALWQGSADPATYPVGAHTMGHWQRFGGASPVELLLAINENTELPNGDTAAYTAVVRSADRAATWDLIAAIKAGESRQGPACYYTPTPAGPDAIAWTFPGSGNHAPGMGRELGLLLPRTLHRQSHENHYYASQFAARRFLYRDDHDWLQNPDHREVIFGQVWLGAFVAAALRDSQVTPRAVIGYSLGETAGMFGSGAWQDRDLMFQRIQDSSLFTIDLCGFCRSAREYWQLSADEDFSWLLGVLQAPVADVAAAVARQDKAYILIVNTDQACVIGGERTAVRAVAAEIAAPFHPLPGVTTVHCPVAKPVAEAYRELHDFPTKPAENVIYFSGIAGGAYELNRESIKDSILGQALNHFDYRAVCADAYAKGFRVFLECGPGQSCSRMLAENLSAYDDVTTVSSAPGPHRQVEGFMHALAVAAMHGAPVTVQALAQWPTQAAEPGIKVRLRQQAAPVAKPAATRPVPEPQANQVPQANQTQHARAVSQTTRSSQTPLASNAHASDSASTPHGTVTQPGHGSTMPPLPNTSTSPTSPATQQTSQQHPAVQAQEVTPPDNALWHLFLRQQQEFVSAHQRYLAFSARTQALLAQTAGALTDPSTMTVATPSVPAPPASTAAPERGSYISQSTAPRLRASDIPRLPRQAHPEALYDRDACMEYAIGSIGKMLGPQFAAIDSYPTRVRLPDDPLMLCDRIMAIDGEAGSMGAGRVVTQHDVLEGLWYLDCNRIPTAICVEAGQADLFLSGFLGIDFQTKGEAVYRLLDATITYHRPLPHVGEMIHYDIRINKFFQQGDTWLFRFEYDATVDGEPLLTMRDGCAGFFTEQALAAGQGINVNAKRPGRGAGHMDWHAPVPFAGPEAYSAEQLDALRTGNLTACFGTAFERVALQLSQPLTIPGAAGAQNEPMRLVHRILTLEPQGGHWGHGRIVGEANIHADDWFITCHFSDDPVMPGTLMYECCLHTLRVLALRLGLVGDASQAAVVWEPIPGQRSSLKCRGQVLGHTKTVQYQIDLQSITFAADGTPELRAEALMSADHKPVVLMEGMSLRLSGTTREDLQRVWQTASTPASPVPDTRTPPAISGYDQRPPIFTAEQVMAYAVGNPSEGFGDRYRIFDEGTGRIIARLPGPPFLFVDRITEIKDCEAWNLKAGGAITSQYDVPADAWYFDADRSNTMPFAVLLETALQPCGWFAAYLGSALTSEVDIKFRNLGGKATLHRAIARDVGTLTTTVKMTQVSQSGGMIIQHYHMLMEDRHGVVYEGTTYFGFFTADALANQVGIRDADVYQPSEAERARATVGEAFPTQAPFSDSEWCMLTQIRHADPLGGPQGVGCYIATLTVDPSSWYFKAHFYQDPVTPGSLGLESFLQLAKVAIRDRWGVDAASNFLCVAPTREHQWVYRGQILPTDDTVTVTLTVDTWDDAQRIVSASGFLSVDGRVIYQCIDFTVQLA